MKVDCEFPWGEQPGSVHDEQMYGYRWDLLGASMV
jgi:hypothetical protein